MEPYLLCSAAPKHLLCPRCQKLFIDPVISTSCGHTFCRKCVNENSTCNLDNTVISKHSIVPNLNIISQFNEFNVFCKNHFLPAKNGEIPSVDPEGCKAVVKFVDQEKHAEECDFAYTTCSKECGDRIRRKDVNEHQCDFYSNNSVEDVNGLTSNPCVCVQELLHVVHQNMDLKNQLAEVTQQNVALRAQMNVLSGKIDKLSTNQAAAFEKLEFFMKHLSGNNRLPRTLSQVDLIQIQRSNHNAIDQNEVYFYQFSMENWSMPFAFKCIGILKGHTKALHCLAVARPGFMYTAGMESDIRVWDISKLIRGQTGTHEGKGCVALLRGHQGAVNCLVVQEQFLFSAGADKSLRKWCLTDRRLVVEKLNVHRNDITSLAVADARLFSGSRAEVRVWSTDELEFVQVIGDLNHFVRAMIVSSDKKFLFAGVQNAIFFWDIKSEDCGAVTSTVSESSLVIKDFVASRCSIRQEFGHVHSLELTSQFLIVGTFDQSIQIFDRTSHTLLTTLRGHVGCVSALKVSPSGRWLFSASSDSSVQVWDLHNSLTVQSLTRHSGGVRALGIFGDLLFSVGDDSEVKVYKYFKLDTLR